MMMMTFAIGLKSQSRSLSLHNLHEYDEYGGEYGDADVDDGDDDLDFLFAGL